MNKNTHTNVLCFLPVNVIVTYASRMCSPILDSGNPTGVLNATEQPGIPSGWNGEDPKGTGSNFKIQTLKELSESGGQYVIGEGVDLLIQD